MASASGWRWDSPPRARVSACWPAARRSSTWPSSKSSTPAAWRCECAPMCATASRFRAAVDRMRVQFGAVDILIAAAASARPDRPAGEHQPAAVGGDGGNQPDGRGARLPGRAAADDRAAIGQDHRDLRRRRGLRASEFFGLRRVESGGGAAGGNAGGRGPRRATSRSTAWRRAAPTPA